MDRLLFVGLDVDDNSFNLAWLDVLSGERGGQKLRPNAKSVAKYLEAFRKSHKVKICYEATYLGFSIYRELRALGLDCEVIAPSLIPKTSGARVKTDRLDAEKLARYYATNLLTVVHAPTPEEENSRRLLRSRKFMIEQLTQVKNRINALCRTLGWNFKSEMEKKNYWTQIHYKWLEEKLKTTNLIEFNLLLSHLRQMQSTLDIFDVEISKLANTPEYLKKVRALTCYRSLDELSAMTLITELGDIKRFSHPAKLASYVGFDIHEISSGGEEKKIGITNLGNRYIRSTVVEATQLALNPPLVSRFLKQRRIGAEPAAIDVADRCMKRLYSKGSRLLYKGKHKNKIKVACAREMLCFIWESLNLVS